MIARLTRIRSSMDSRPRTTSDVCRSTHIAIEMMRELAHRLEDTNKKLRAATATKAA